MENNQRHKIPLWVRMKLAETIKARPNFSPFLDTAFFMLHRMHEMQTIVTDVCGVCLSCAAQLGFTVLGHLVQPLPNDFGLLFVHSLAYVITSLYIQQL